MSILSRRAAAVVFLAFAFAYFFSALIRAITATLSPTLTQEFALSARDLGLLAGGYFIGFSAVQLPLGRWLDRHGPKKVILVFLSVAVAGCLAFSLATSFTSLLLARVLCGVGVGACLMAPLTGYRRWFEPALQMRANSWMLMTGSFGMVASTLPVQWLMPLVGWRFLFVALAALVLLSMVVIYWQVPRWQPTAAASGAPAGSTSYAEVWRHPYFRKMALIGFVNYGGLIALQTLWATPWMIRVAGYSPVQAATGLFWINLAMLGTFWTWGWINPWLTRRGLKAEWLIARGQPVSFVLLLLVIGSAQAWPDGAALLLALFCVSSTFVSLAQPAVGMAFPAALAGRALSAYNLVIFSGVFAVQWGLGLLIDGFAALGLAGVPAFQAALGVFLLLCMAAYAHFLGAKSHNQAS
jgi:predicted MFS family arabinose efflux permease